MSPSEQAAPSFETLASEISALCADAIEANRLGDIPDDSLGQVFASVVRLFAAKAQAGPAPRPFGRNSGVTPTDRRDRLQCDARRRRPRGVRAGGLAGDVAGRPPAKPAQLKRNKERTAR